jgi:hypothetical protein
MCSMCHFNKKYKRIKIASFQTLSNIIFPIPKKLITFFECNNTELIVIIESPFHIEMENIPNLMFSDIYRLIY